MANGNQWLVQWWMDVVTVGDFRAVTHEQIISGHHLIFKFNILLITMMLIFAIHFIGNEKYFFKDPFKKSFISSVSGTSFLVWRVQRWEDMWEAGDSWIGGWHNG